MKAHAPAPSYEGLEHTPYFYTCVDGFIEASAKRSRFKPEHPRSAKARELAAEEMEWAEKLALMVHHESGLYGIYGFAMLTDDRPGGLTWVAFPAGMGSKVRLDVSAGGRTWTSLARNLMTIEAGDELEVDVRSFKIIEPARLRISSSGISQIFS